MPASSDSSNLRLRPYSTRRQSGEAAYPLANDGIEVHRCREVDLSAIQMECYMHILTSILTHLPSPVACFCSSSPASSRRRMPSFARSMTLALLLSLGASAAPARQVYLGSDEHGKPFNALEHMSGIAPYHDGMSGGLPGVYLMCLGAS